MTLNPTFSLLDSTASSAIRCSAPTPHLAHCPQIPRKPHVLVFHFPPQDLLDSFHPNPEPCLPCGRGAVPALLHGPAPVPWTPPLRSYSRPKFLQLAPLPFVFFPPYLSDPPHPHLCMSYNLPSSKILPHDPRSSSHCQLDF